MGRAGLGRSAIQLTMPWMLPILGSQAAWDRLRVFMQNNHLTVNARLHVLPVVWGAPRSTP